MFFKINNVKANFVFAYFIGASLAPRRLRVTRCWGPVRWSGRGLCTLGLPLSSATMCSPPIPSSRIQPCPPTQPPTPSPSWRRRAGGLRKRGGSLEHCRQSRGEKTCSPEDHSSYMIRSGLICYCMKIISCGLPLGQWHLFVRPDLFENALKKHFMHKLPDYAFLRSFPKKNF